MRRAIPHRFVARVLVFALWAQTVGPPADAYRERPVSLRSIPASFSSALPSTAVQPAPASFGIQLTPLTTLSNDHLGIDHHDAARKVVTAGSRIAIARDDGQGRSRGGFTPGDLFMGAGVPGVITHVDPTGATHQRTWVTLPGETGLVTGLSIDRTGVFSGELIAVTSDGGVWRISSSRVATRIANLKTSLEGVTTLPNDATNYGPWAGTILVCAPQEGSLYTVNGQGAATSNRININLQDVRVVPARENFYGIDSASRRIWGAPAEAFTAMIGDILAAQESPGALLRIHWNGASFEVTEIARTAAWAQITFSPAGLGEIGAVKELHDRIAVVRHAPALESGRVEGALRLLSAENVVLDGRDVITSDLLVPGTPRVVVGAGRPRFGGVIEGDGSAQPTDHSVTIKGNATLGHLITRTDPIELQPVAAPPRPSGTRDVTLTKANEPIGDLSTLHDLSLSGKAGGVAVPPGTYGRFTASGQTALIFGIDGSTERAIYNLEELVIGGGSELRLRGPVEITIARRVVVSGLSVAGAIAQPSWLLLRVANPVLPPLDPDPENGCVETGLGSDSSGVGVCGNGVLHAVVRAPERSISIHGNGRIRGTTTSARLRITGNGVLQVTENDLPPPAINRPPTVDAGADQVITLPTDTVSLSGTATDDGLPRGSTLAFTWTAVHAPGPVVFGDPNSAATTATFVQPGFYVLRLTASDSLLTGSDDLQVEVVAQNQPPVVEAGADQSIELPNTATLRGTASDDGLPSGSTLATTWSQANGPGTVTFGDASQLSTTAAFSAMGTYVLRLSASDTELTSNDEVTIIVTEVNRNQGPNVSAGADQAITFPAASHLNGVATDDGLPAGSTLSVSWSRVGGPGTVTFDRPDAATTAASFSVAGIYLLRLTATDSQMTSTDDVIVTDDAANQAPVVNAGSDQSITLPNAANLNATVSDDSLPARSVVVTSWSKISGPGAVAFDNPNAPVTVASFSARGTYVLRITASDSDLSSQDDVTVAVGMLNEPPTVSAGADQIVTLPDAASLAGTVIDDGLPAASTLVTWSQVSGPGTVDFTDLHSAVTSATFSVAGAYVLRLSASDTQLTASDDANVVVRTPTVDLAIGRVTTVGVVTDPQTLVASGPVQIDIQNQGADPSRHSFEVLVFEDTNRNGTYQSLVDKLLGVDVFTGSIAANGAATLAVAISGVVSFGGNSVYAFVDSAQQVPEIDETNNIASSALGSTHQPPPGTFAPKVKWAYLPSTGIVVTGAPIVAPLEDTNDDQVVDERDIPAVVFVSGHPNGVSLTALHGNTGTVLFETPVATTNRLDLLTNPAVGDLDGDGKKEIVAAECCRSVVHAFNSNGSERWSATDPNLRLRSSPTIADLNGDGRAEILYGDSILNSSGAVVRATRSPGYVGGNNQTGAASQVADLDLNGVPEIISGPAAFDKDGNTLWFWRAEFNRSWIVRGTLDLGKTIVTLNINFNLNDSFTAVANLDADPHPEIVVVSDQQASGTGVCADSLWVFEHDGRLKPGFPICLYLEVANQESYRLGAPTIADFDGDLQPEIAIPAQRVPTAGFESAANPSRFMLAVYERDGHLNWRRELTPQIAQTAAPSAIAADLDGDGAAEVVFGDHQFVYILDGRTGNTLYKQGVPQRVGWTAYPVIADVDNDGLPEILVAAEGNNAGTAPLGGVLAIGDTSGNWRNARRVWNQWLYHVTNVREDGGIPAQQANNWLTYNNGRAQVSIDGLDALAAPDLSVSRFTIDSQSCPASVGLTARVGNSGTLQAGAGQRVNFYNGDPAASGALLGVAHTTRRLAPGESEDVTLTSIAAPFPSQVFVTVGEALAPARVDSSNLARLPFTWAESSGYCVNCGPVVNFDAYDGIDGATSTHWRYLQGITPTDPPFYEVHFPFPVDATSIRVENRTGSPTGFLTGVAEFSNGFSEPFGFDANGEGTISFPEQQNISWIRLTGTTTRAGGPSVTELIVPGKYAEPQFTIKEGAGGEANNKTSSPPNLALCDPSVEQPPFITSAPPIRATVDNLYSYQVEADDLNKDPLSFSLLAAPSGMSLGGAGLIAWTPTSAQLGNHPVTVQVSDGRGGTAEQSFTVRVRRANQAPIVEAGADQTITLNNPAILNGTADDDGLPAGSSLTASWTMVSGPGTVTFGSSKAMATTATFSAVGSYVLRLTASDSQFTVSDDVSITVDPTPPNQAPAVDAGPDQSVTLPNKLALFSNVTDDGLPVGGVVSSAWSQVSGPGVVSFVPGLLNIVTASFSEPGLYVLRLTAGDSQLASSDDIAVNVIGAPLNHAPTVDAGADQSINLPSAATLIGVVADDGLPANSTVTRLWSTASGPGPVTFGDPSQASTTATFTTTGTYVLRLSANDSELTGSDDITIEVFDPITGPAPTVSITSPANGSAITSKVNVVGTISGGNWRLEYSLNSNDGANAQTWTTIASGSTPVTDAILGSFDSTLLLNGVYGIRLIARDGSGQTSMHEMSAVVHGDQKVGNFTLSFVDLDVPVAGIPIQVIRTYDSRDKRRGDFGIGWTLGVKNVRVEKSGKLGKQWEQTRSSGFAPTYCLQQFRPQSVTITFGDGKVYRFEPVTTPQCQALTPIQFATLGFRQVPASIATGGATLESLSGIEVIVSGSVPGPAELLDLNTLTHFNPTLFRLTTAGGDVYLIDQQAGVRSMTDTNGNTLTINSNGIIHSSGKSVTFARDTHSRITSITDPMGRSMSYAYDAAGDLVSVTDRDDNRTTFAYNSTHGLTGITDPRGVQPIRNEYDDDGRLVRNIDAFGKEINYTHDLNARREIITDRLGNITVHEYDASGNVVKTTDAEGGVTTFTYDARGNELSITNALGKTTLFTYDTLDNNTSKTDPLGNKTTYTYDSRRQVLITTDARGGVTTNTYDSHGNLASTRDALGKVTSFTYDAAGRQISRTDALGNITGYAYDAAGDLTRETDALGNVTTYTYDSNGNRLSQSMTRTTASGVLEALVTTFNYDGLNRLVKTTYPDGSSTEATYTNIGQESVERDQLGREVAYEYDAGGRLIRTTYPDGTQEQATYDAEGRRVASTDRADRQTTYRYDKVGRLVETIFADKTRTSIAYDLMGREISRTDGRGNVTTYEYDSNCGCADRRTRVIDARGNVSVYTFDANGNRETMSDAAGNTMRFEYDANNRQTKVVHADGTVATTTYDANGRVSARADQAGKTTRFEYDALGRLAQVIDALGQATTFGYDEVGNQLSQTDANNQTTTFEYDTMRRRIRRTLPLGIAESFTHDDAGNVSSRTDFGGKTTTYTYDALNRRLSKTPDPTLRQPAVTFTYTATGRRASMIDASGTTAYTYDARDRLTSKSTPHGTLSYDYDTAGNLLALSSSNTNGTSVHYTYDALNRLSTVSDDRWPAGTNTTTYSYDANGNLSTYTYPNGVTAAYTYNTVNRMTDVTINKLNTLAHYAYTVGTVGNRLSVTELNGRKVSYGYDALYRLTSETVSDDPAAVNGTVTYVYDAVGNRLSRASTLPNLPGAHYSYDANDRLISDVYDANGNTTRSEGRTYEYDFEDRLTDVSVGSVKYVYDGDGNRVAKTVGGVTTRYLVDTNNLTGYAQVVEEVVDGSVQRAYTYGLQRINQRQLIGGNWVTSFYGYDGHGSVRLLADASGLVTDTYTYDAFGNLIGRTGTTPNEYLYAGEQLDANVGFYYLRARYMNPATGRFWTMDTFEGSVFEPLSLHKYLYAHSDPVNRTDPSGLFGLIEVMFVVAVIAILLSASSAYAKELPKRVEAQRAGIETMSEARRQISLAQQAMDQGEDLRSAQSSTPSGLEAVGDESVFGPDPGRTKAVKVYKAMHKLAAKNFVKFRPTSRDVFKASCPPGGDYIISMSSSFIKKTSQNQKTFAFLWALARWGLNNNAHGCGEENPNTDAVAAMSLGTFTDPSTYAWFALTRINGSSR